MRVQQVHLKKLGFSALSAIAVALTFPLASLAEDARLLGQTRLSYGDKDLDVMVVSGKCPTLSAVKIRAAQGSADIAELAVRYGNDAWERLSLRENFRQGSESRWIDLRGGQRCVTGIAVIGDTNNRSSNRTLVQIFGK
jgi:hypothetical protein